MKLIVGLGNPGEKYAMTRHNAGWIVLGWFVEREFRDASWSENKKLRAAVCRSSDVIYAKPLTFMNSSGETVKRLVSYHKIPLGNLLVIHDDLDLPLGEYRLQKGRGAAGHKGVQSVIDCMDSSDFWRLRVGIGRPSPFRHPEFISGSKSSKMLNQVQHDKALEAEYVLQNFSEEELKVLEELFENKLVSKIKNWISQ